MKAKCAIQAKINFTNTTNAMSTGQARTSMLELEECD